MAKFKAPVTKRYRTPEEQDKADQGLFAGFDIFRQQHNLRRGIIKAADGVKQLKAELEEMTGGPEMKGHADFVTQQLLAEQAAREAEDHIASRLPGAGGVEFVGEALPYVAVPFGGTALRAAGLSAAASSTIFNPESSLLTRGLQAGGGGLFGGILGKALLRGGPARAAAQRSIDE